MDSNNYDQDYINTLEGKDRYNVLLSQGDKEKLKNWEKEQESLKNNLCFEDDPLLQDIMYIGGMDISYDKRDKKTGISGLIILDYKTLEIVYEDYNLVKIDEPYIPGFLAFREVKHFVKLIDDLKQNAPQFLPQVILLDGNGIIHSKQFGLACHLGVLTDTTTIGCSKSIFSVDGLTKDLIEGMTKDYLHKKGDSKELVGMSGRQWGYILKSSNEEDKPLIISMGNKISNQTALKVVKKMCKQRIPEPIRLADLITRRLIKARTKYGKNNNIWNWNLKDYLVDQHDFLHANLEQIIEDNNKDDNRDENEEEMFFRGRGRGRGRGYFRGRGRGFRGGRGEFRGGRGEFRGGRGEFRGGRGHFRGGRGDFRGRGRGRGFRGRGEFRGGIEEN